MESGELNFITPEYPCRDMPETMALTWSLFLSMGIVGWGLYELYSKTKTSEQRFNEIEDHLHSVETAHIVQTVTAQELEQRLREKKDYDDTEEIQEDTYQAWKGLYEKGDLQLSIVIWREKLSSVAKNQQWLDWDGQADASCTVRDFYLGNGSPDFAWMVRQTDEFGFNATVSETMVNGWDSVIKMSLHLHCPSLRTLIEDENGMADTPSETCNGMLGRVVSTNGITWSRALLPKTEAL